jgi:hypothetical protein
MDLLILWTFMGYGMSTILVYGSIFEKQREWIKRNSKFFGDLIGCIMCTSTWVGFFMSLSFWIFTGHWEYSLTVCLLVEPFGRLMRLLNFSKKAD